MHCNRHSNKKALLALLAFTLLLAPFAGAAVAPLATLDIEASVPAYSQTATLSVTGRTLPNSTVHAFINNVRVRVANANKIDGTFALINMPLSAADNTLKLEAHSGTNIATKEFTVAYDGTPPTVKLDKDIPPSTQATSLTVSGDVNEKVTIHHRVINRKYAVPPEILTNAKASKIEANAVELTWNPSTATDLKEYVILRDGKRIAATALTGFRDDNLPSNKAFTYGISAVDASCNVGTSADISATTKTGGRNVTLTQPPHINLSCETPFQTTSAGSPFSLTLTLQQGINSIEIIFQDAAGNKAVINKTVLMDSSPPKFTQTNLAELSPSYSPDVTIKGKLDEQATVFLYINNESKPSGFVVTGPDGSFSIKTHLRTDVRIKKGTKKAGIEVGEGWANRVRLEAVDLAGNKFSYGPSTIDFLLCGTGTWWQTNIGEAMPSTLLPRLMIQGIQQIGIPFNISYIGNQQVKLGKVDVRPIPLAPSAAKDYDHDWVQVSTLKGKMTPKSQVGYVQIQFENVDPMPDKPDAGPNAKELNLSSHRRGECLVPAFGCVKIFLQMEIQFQEIIPFKTTDPRLPVPSPQIETRVQRICMPLEVSIDQTVPLDIIPKGLLRTAVKVIGKVITLIDKVLKPLTTIGEYVLYGCLASNVWLYVQFFQEKLACEGSQLIEAVAGGGGFSKAIAEAGLCDAVYGGNTGDSSSAQKQQACKKCESTIASRKKFEMNIMHGLCDRIACPPAPTFSSYIRDQIGEAEELAIDATTVQNNPDLRKWAVGSTGTEGDGKIFAGNDCAFTYRPTDPKKGLMDFITPTYGGGSTTFTRQVTRPLTPAEHPEMPEEAKYYEKTETVTGTYGKLGIRELYDIAKGTTTPKSGPTADDCKKVLHPAHPNCCGVQYQKEWSSACGIGTTLGDSLDTFDELKQSTCLSAQQANVDAKDLSCNNVWNAVAGFCEKNTGEPRAETVNALAKWNPPKVGADDNAAYVFVLPTGFRQGKVPTQASGDLVKYEVWLGYAVKTPQIQKLPEGELGRVRNNQFPLSASMTAALENDLSTCFGQKPAVRAEKTEQKATRMEEQEQIKCVKERISTGGCKIQPCEDQGNIKTFVQQVNEVVQVPDKQYIVRPSSGLFRSIQCVCLPAVTSYLMMWQKVLAAFHGCFSKILLTGEGSAGFCAAKFSGTICDLFFEAISCFVQKFNTAGAGGRAGTGGFGDILGALTGAGTDVSKSVTSRYGNTGLYQSLFSERKLLHAVCTWAFTGTWSLDMKGLFQQQVQDIPVDTEGALTTCQRTFISYDPTTQPPGLTTWAYRIAGGLIAGADVRYRLRLKCSSGFTCDPRAYKDGKCDCQSKEDIVTISDPSLGSGLARKFDLVNFDAPFVINAQSPDSGPRYDTALLEWDWTDPTTKQVRTGKADCSIRETEGGNPPLFCALDAFSGKFRCLFGEQENGIRVTAAAPVYPQNQNVFGLGQKLSFGVDLKQKYPEERRMQQGAKKFLTYEIKDAAGATVQGTLGGILKPLKTTNDVVTLPYELTTNGVYRTLVPKEGAAGAADGTPLSLFTLDQDTILRHSASGPSGLRPPQDIWPVSTTIRPITDVKVSKSDGTAYDQPVYFSIHFPTYKLDAGEENYNIYRLTPPTQALPQKGTNGWAQYRGTIVPMPTGKQSAQKPLNTVTFTIPPASAFQQPLTVTVTFERIIGFSNANELEVAFAYEKPQPATGPKVCDPSKPLTWFATFTIYDADRHGNPSEQVSTDPDTGEEQKKTIDFKVQCAQPAAIVAAGAPPKQVGLVPEAQLVQLITANKGTDEARRAKLAAVKPATVWVTGINLPLAVSNLKIDLMTESAGLDQFKTYLDSLAAQLPAERRVLVLPNFAAQLADLKAAITATNAELDKASIDPALVENALNAVIAKLQLIIDAQASTLTALGKPAAGGAPAGAKTCKDLSGECGIPSDTCSERGRQPLYEATDCSECCKLAVTAAPSGKTCVAQGGTCGIPSDSCTGTPLYDTPDCPECCKKA